MIMMLTSIWVIAFSSNSYHVTPDKTWVVHGSVYNDFDYFSVLSIHSPSLNNVRKFDDILYSECSAAKPRVGTVHLATSDIDKL